MLIKPRRSRCRPIATLDETQLPRPESELRKHLQHSPGSKATSRPPNKPKVVVMLRRSVSRFSGMNLTQDGGSPIRPPKEGSPKRITPIHSVASGAGDNPSLPVAGAAKSPRRKNNKPVSKKPRKSRRQKQAIVTRRGSKKAKIVALLERPGGASLKELQKATGWQPHSVRGFISAQLKAKMALAVDLKHRDDGSRAYLIRSK